jgi:hypothetical protein
MGIIHNITQKLFVKKHAPEPSDPETLRFDFKER